MDQGLLASLFSFGDKSKRMLADALRNPGQWADMIGSRANQDWFPQDGESQDDKNRKLLNMAMALGPMAISGIKPVNGAFNGTIDRTKTVPVTDYELFSQNASLPHSAAVAEDINMRVSPLDNGDYVLRYSPLWGSTSKEFHMIGSDPSELAKAGLDYLNRSNKAIESAQKSKEANSLFGKLRSEFGDTFSTARSTQSKSEYITHDPSGLKIRISDHNLPLHYDQPDLDIPKALSTDEKFQLIKKFLSGGGSE